MIPFLHEYPYTNFSEINLDYILKAVHALDKNIDGLKLRIDSKYIYLLDNAGNVQSQILYPDSNGIFSFKAYTNDDTGSIYDLEVDEFILIDSDLTPSMYPEILNIWESGKCIIQVENYSEEFQATTIHFAGFLQIANSTYPTFSLFDSYNKNWLVFQIFYNNLTNKLQIKRLY